MLTDAARCQVVLVTLPEETPVNELVDTAYHLEDRVGVSLGPVVVNGLVPDDRRPRRRPRRPRPRPTGRRCSPARPRPCAAAAAGSGPSGGPCRPSSSPASPRPSRCPSCTCPHLPATDLGGAELDLLATALLAGHRGRCPDERAEPARPRRARRLGARSSICCGSGGVGKTTTAAVLAMEAARRGRKAAVVTIDPARRLANAMGLEGLSNEPGQVAGRLARRAVGADARHQVDLRPPGHHLRRRPGAGRADPREPLLPEHLRRPVGHPGVHGHREALRAAPRPRLRPRRGRHPADPQRPRLPRRPEPAGPLPRPPPLPHPDDADPRGDEGGVGGRPGVRPVGHQGGRRRGVRRRHHLLHRLRRHGAGVQGAGRRPSRPSSPTSAPPSCWSPHPAATPSRRPGSSPPSWPRAASPSGPSSSTACSRASATATAAGHRRPGRDARRARRSAASTGNLADMQAVADREEHHLADLAAEVAPAPVIRVPLLADRRPRPRGPRPGRRPPPRGRRQAAQLPA